MNNGVFVSLLCRLLLAGAFSQIKQAFRNAGAHANPVTDQGELY
jgi:hypothetical protein